MSDLTTQKTNLLVDKKVKKEDKNALGKSFKSILIDFDVIPYVIGFIIALSFHNLLSKLSNTIIQKVFKIKNTLLDAVFEFILMLIFIYIFIYGIYYQYLFSEDISKENIIKKAINEAKIDKAKKEIEKDVETKKSIEKDVELDNNKSIEEYFTNKF